MFRLKVFQSDVMLMSVKDGPRLRSWSVVCTFE